MPHTVQPLEFWFDFGSNYSYISTLRIEALAREHGVPLRWRPFLLGPIFRSFGWESSPFVLQKAKGEYVWRDMQRACRKVGIAWTRPTEFPRAAVLASRVALAGTEASWVAEFCRRVMCRNFVDDREIASRDAVAELLHGMGLPVDAWLQAAEAAPNKLALRAQTEEAVRRGIFGAPTFFAGDEMFWGNDRLEDALARAAGQR
jgi:2-hydroxychromene-2-carboxylate isomerase